MSNIHKPIEYIKFPEILEDQLDLSIECDYNKSKQILDLLLIGSPYKTSTITIYADTNRLQCGPNKNRSISDSIDLLSYYLPNSSTVELTRFLFIYLLRNNLDTFLGNSSTNIVFKIFHCDDIERSVISSSRGNYYGWSVLYSLWGLLADISITDIWANHPDLTNNMLYFSNFTELETDCASYYLGILGLSKEDTHKDMEEILDYLINLEY